MGSAVCVCVCVCVCVVGWVTGSWEYIHCGVELEAVGWADRMHLLSGQPNF